MNGERYFLDTNAIVNLLRGNIPLAIKLQSSVWVGISVISQIEFFAFSNLSEQDRLLFKKFCSRIEIIDLHSSNLILIEHILRIRITYKLKLPDAIIAASAIQNNAILITDDKDFHRIVELNVVSISYLINR